MIKIEDLRKHGWEYGINKVCNAECLAAMKLIPDKSVDLVLTDPPYDKETHKGGRFGKNNTFGEITFGEIDVLPLVAEFLRISRKWVLVFTTVEQLGKIRTEYPSEYVRGGIWDRVNPSPQISGDRPAQAVEGIAILHNNGRKVWNGGGKAGIWRYSSFEQTPKQHETQKPLNLIRQLLADFSTKETDLVFDPFMGSWTTARAAKDLGRDFIGFELSEKYCRVGEQRLAQGNLF